MSQIVQLGRGSDDARRIVDKDAPTIRTDSVYVIFTTIDDTLAAVRVADRLAKAMTVPVTLVHFRTVPYQLPVDSPDGMSPAETDAFAAKVREKGVDLRVRVYLCRHEQRTIPMAFKRHSIVVLAGRNRWWRTQAGRWRRWLEAAGHFVVFVETSEQEEQARA